LNAYGSRVVSTQPSREVARAVMVWEPSGRSLRPNLGKCLPWVQAPSFSLYS